MLSKLRSIGTKLKTRWKVESNLQLFLILVAFSLAGSLVLYVRKFVFNLMGITSDTPFLLRFLLWILVVFPSYQVILLIVGSLLGQFKFFWNFEKKTLRRMKILPPEKAPES